MLFGFGGCLMGKVGPSFPKLSFGVSALRLREGFLLKRCCYKKKRTTTTARRQQREDNSDNDKESREETRFEEDDMKTRWRRAVSSTPKALLGVAVRQRQHSHRSGSLIQPSNANSINNTHSQTNQDRDSRAVENQLVISANMERPAFSFTASPCHTAASFARFWTSRWPGKPAALPPSANQLLAAPWAGRTLRQRLGVIEQPLSGGRTVVNSDLLRLHPFLVCGSKKATDMGARPFTKVLSPTKAILPCLVSHT